MASGQLSCVALAPCCHEMHKLQEPCGRTCHCCFRATRSCKQLAALLLAARLSDGGSGTGRVSGGGGGLHARSGTLIFCAVQPAPGGVSSPADEQYATLWVAARRLGRIALLCPSKYLEGGTRRAPAMLSPLDRREADGELLGRGSH